MFRFKGITNEEMEVVAEEENFLGRAARRVESTAVFDADGASFRYGGREPIERSVKLFVLNLARMDDILAWLDGEGTFEFEGRITTARFLTEVAPERLSAIKIIETRFIRDAFWHPLTEADQTISTFPAVITNPGNTESEPLLKITGSGTVNLTLNGVTFAYVFDTPYVYIDCQSGPGRDVFHLDVKKTRNKSGGYPFLSPGSNELVINNGTVSEVIVTKRSRYL